MDTHTAISHQAAADHCRVGKDKLFLPHYYSKERKEAGLQHCYIVRSKFMLRYRLYEEIFIEESLSESNNSI